MKLKDKVAIVTGGAQGIGLAIVRRFAEEGATVVIGDVLLSGEEKAKAFRKDGKNVFFHLLDVSDQQSIARFVAAVFKVDDHIDILVNNAGILRDELLSQLSAENFDAVIGINLRGVALMTHHVAPHLTTPGGVILNASSVVWAGNFGQTSYAAAKGGINAMTVTWAREYAKRGIRVNAVAPGFTETEMTGKMPEKAKARVLAQIPMGRFATTEEVANVYCFLASDEAAYVTGAVIPVDGGAVV